MSVTLDFDEVVTRTDDAVLLSFEDDREEWLPFTEIEELDDVRCVVTIPDWLARDRGLE